MSRHTIGSLLHYRAAVRVCVVSFLASAVGVGTWAAGGAASRWTSHSESGRAAQLPLAVSMRGVVLAEGDQPLPGVRIDVRNADSEVVQGFTDTSGRFEIVGLAPGQYSVHASKRGYIASGASRTVRQVDVVAGQPHDAVDFRLVKSAVIEGRVSDDRGNPVSHALVTLWRRGWEEGERTLSPLSPGDHTDDRGDFRLYDIPPGAYVVAVESANPFGNGRATYYYPAGYTASEAEAVRVSAGQEVVGLNIIQAPLPHAAISGTVSRFDGLEPNLNEVHVSAAGLRVADWFFSVKPDASGQYNFNSLAAGEYWISVEDRTSPTPLRASEKVVLQGNDVTVSLVLRPSVSLRGRYLLESGQRPTGSRPPVAAVGRVLFATEGGRGVPGEAWWKIEDDWNFEAKVLPGRYVFRPPVPPGWAVKAVLFRGADITDTLLEVQDTDVEGVVVVLTQVLTQVSGTVARADGVLAPEALVVVFPEEDARLRPRSRYVKSVRADRDGKYRVLGLPPARYLIAALDDIDPGEETSPDVLLRLRGFAKAFALADGESRVVDVNVMERPQQLPTLTRTIGPPGSQSSYRTR